MGQLKIGIALWLYTVVISLIAVSAFRCLAPPPAPPPLPPTSTASSAPLPKPSFTVGQWSSAECAWAKGILLEARASHYYYAYVLADPLTFQASFVSNTAALTLTP